MASGPLYVGIQPHEIGEYSYIGEFSHVAQHTKIGRYCSIGNLCTIGATQHRLSRLTTFSFNEQAPHAPTVVGNDVWIGSTSVILAGITINDGAVIGAGSVVTHDIPAYAIAAGRPARILRYRFSAELIAGLLTTKWWELPEAEVQALPLDEPTKCLEILRARAA